MNKSPVGFTLIELIIAIALSSIVSVVLINGLYQMSRFRAMVDERVYVYSHAAVIQQQMERDITSAFIPDLIKTSTKSQEKEGASQAGGANQVGSEKSSTEKTGANSVNQGESEQRDMGKKKWFYGVRAGENLDVFTCITTSPLPVYWGTKSGTPRARIARVVYRLQRDSERPDSYILYRQEGFDLDFDSYKENGPRNFVLAKDVKSMTVSYEAEIRKKESEQESAPEYKLFPEWDSDKLTKNKLDKNKIDGENSGRQLDGEARRSYEAKAGAASEDRASGEGESRTPHSVIIELRLWNPEHTQDRLFKFVYTVVWQDTKNKASSFTNPGSESQKAEQASAPGAGSTSSSTGADAVGSGATSGLSGTPNNARGAVKSGARTTASHTPKKAKVRSERGEIAEPAADMLAKVVIESTKIVGV